MEHILQGQMYQGRFTRERNERDTQTYKENKRYPDPASNSVSGTTLTNTSTYTRQITQQNAKL